MKIDLTEMMRIKGRLGDINNEMYSVFSGINQEFDSISSNVNSEGLHGAIVTIQSNIIELANVFSENMSVLEEFMEGQLSSYTVTNEEAKQSLESLVNLVNQTFDESGNVISATAIAAYTDSKKTNNNTNASGKMADSNISDADGYSAGESKQDYLNNKIDYSDTKKQRINDTYYFFKSKGLSDEQIAGIIGNITQESAFDLKCPTGKYCGLFQWDPSRYPDNFEFQTQLDHAWEEIENTRHNGKVLSNLSTKTTVDDATESFAYWFEGCTSEMRERKGYAEAVYYYIKNNL